LEKSRLSPLVSSLFLFFSSDVYVENYLYERIVVKKKNI